MTKDRLKKDYDNVENLSDLIEAREERDSASADDLDAMEDIENEGLPVDAVDELTWPHPKGRSEEDGRLGINVDLMDTPDEKEIEFDWQDSAEEMLTTDPEPSEGMGADASVGAMARVDATDLAGEEPLAEVSTETDTTTAEAEEEYSLDDGQPQPVVELESAMDTDSDEGDFAIEDKFEGQMDRETALLEFEEMRRATEGREDSKPEIRNSKQNQKDKS